MRKFVYLSGYMMNRVQKFRESHHTDEQTTLSRLIAYGLDFVEKEGLEDKYNIEDIKKRGKL